MERAAAAAMELEFGETLREAGTSAEQCDAEISVTVVDGVEIRELNRDYRGIDRVTDVLSFPQYDDPEELEEELTAGESSVLIGDVVLCYDRAVSQAEEYGTGIVRETVYLFTHSILHLLGYDHEDEDERAVMRKREEEIMEAIGVGRQQ